jgi:hypothetical protein
MSFQSTLDINGIPVQTETVNFINAVLDPFKATEAAKVPDFQKTSSCCMRDYIDAKTLSVDSANTGLFLMWAWGMNSMIMNIIASGDFDPDQYYYLIAIPFGSTGVLYYNEAVIIGYINFSTIMGMSTSGVADFSGLCEALRLFAGGIKVLPAIETITSSDTIAVRNYWGGNVTPSDIFNIMDEATLENTSKTKKTKEKLTSIKENYVDAKDDSKSDEIYVTKRMRMSGKSLKSIFMRNGVREVNSSLDVHELIRNLANTQEFPNAEGCTVRYNPFQFEEQLEMIPIEEINMGETQPIPSAAATSTFYIAANQQIGTKYSRHLTDNIAFPYICMDFTQTVPADTAFPIKIYASVWMESILIQPTPIYTEKSPVDLNFNKIRGIIGNTDLFPVAVKGHSFKNLFQMAGKFAEQAIRTYKEMAPYGKQMYAAGKGAYKAYKQIKGGKRKRKVRQQVPRKRRRRNPKGRARGAQLPGSKNPNAKISRNTPNNPSTRRKRKTD